MKIKSIGTKEKPAVKILPITKFKATEKDGSLFIEGYANTKNHADRYGDIPTVHKDIRDYVYDIEDFQKNPVMLLDHHNDIEHIAGSFVEIEEDNIGLRFKAQFSNSDLPLIKHARQVYKEGNAKGISIAGIFYYEDKDDSSHLTLADIFEISLVAVPADPNALATAMGKAIDNINDTDEQSRASELHNIKAGIDKVLEKFRLNKIKESINDLSRR